MTVSRDSRRRRAANRRRDWKRAFLAEFRRTGLVAHACRAAGVSRSTVYQARQQDEDFALAWHEVEEETTELMEREAFRRAVIGIERPVYRGGELVGSTREYSDTLLIFMLKARRPEKYRDRHEVHHSGSVDIKQLTADRLREMSDQELAELERRLYSSSN